AAETLEQGELLFSFHALGDHLQMQAVRQRHDRFHDRGIVGPRYQLGDEAAIDLQLVDRKAAPVTHARVAGAEVVDRHYHPHAAELLQDGHGLFRIAHQRALGDLHLEKAWLEVGGLERSEERRVGKEWGTRWRRGVEKRT